MLEVVLGAIIALAIIIVQGLLIRAIVIWVAKRNGYTAKTMPVRYHTWLIAIFCGLLALEVLISHHVR